MASCEKLVARNELREHVALFWAIGEIVEQLDVAFGKPTPWMGDRRWRCAWSLKTIVELLQDREWDWKAEMELLKYLKKQKSIRGCKHSSNVFGLCGSFDKSLFLVCQIIELPTKINTKIVVGCIASPIFIHTTIKRHECIGITEVHYTTVVLGRVQVSQCTLSYLFVNFARCSHNWWGQRWCSYSMSGTQSREGRYYPKACG